MQDDREVVSLSNICGGAVNEVFLREFNTVLANIADINTDAEAKRKLSLEFTISPFKDRSGAKVTFACKSKTMPAESVEGTMFLARRGATIIAVPHDPRQEALKFSETATDHKQ